MPKSYLDQLLKSEEAAASGQATSLNDSQDQRVNKGDYKLAEGLSWLVDEKWEKIRTSIVRGQFIQAKELLSQVDPAELLGQQEVLFEQARICCFEGEFEKALHLVTELQKDKTLNPLTQMTSFQLQALCLYEIGRRDESLEVTEKILALENIFPSAQASLYGRVTRCRALNDLGNTFQADFEAKELWRKIASQVYQINIPLQLIMYCRLMCKLKIKRQVPFASYAMGGYWLAKGMGSPLHEGFFLTDLSISEDNELRSFAESELKTYETRFSCIKRFMKEAFPLNDLKDSSTGLGKYRSEAPQNFLFLDEGFLFDPYKNELSLITVSDKTRSILQYIGNSKRDKEDVFKQVWGVETFNLLNNDSSIRTALKRLREETGITMTSLNMVLEIPHTLVASP